MGSTYQRIIHEIDPTVNPAGVEAFMRLEYHTLDHLPRSKFTEEIELAKVAHLKNPDSLRQAAESYSMDEDYDSWQLQLRQPQPETPPNTPAAPKEKSTSMEYVRTTLSNPTRGQCASCANPDVVLDAVIVSLGHHPTRRNAMNQPITVAVNAHLICGECSRNHPIWSLREEPGIETEAPVAARQPEAGSTLLHHTEPEEIMTDHEHHPADPALTMTFQEALTAIGQRPGPGMDIVAATAVLSGMAPDQAQDTTMNTLYERRPSEALILHFVIDNAPPLPESAVANTHIMAQAQRATPEKLLGIISAHITQAQADEWLSRVEDLLANYQKGVQDAHRAMAITGDPKQAAALSARRIREDLRRTGRTIHPDTEELLQKLEQLSKD